MPTNDQVEWTKRFTGIDPAAPAAISEASGGAAPGLTTAGEASGSGGPDAQSPSPASDTDLGQQIDTALADLEKTVQALVPLGVPAKAADARIAAYRVRAGKGDAKAAPKLLKAIQTDHDRLEAQRALIGEIGGIATDLETQSQQLTADGLPAAPLAAIVASVRTAIPRAAAGGVEPLRKLRAIAIGKRDSLKADADKQRNAMTGGEDNAIFGLRDAAAKQIAAVKDEDLKQALTKELDSLKANIEAIKQATDPASQATARDKAEKAAHALLNKTAKASSDPKAAGKELQAAFKTAIKDKYGIGADASADGHINFEKLFDTLEKMPVGHVAHANMKNIRYEARLRSGDHGIGMFTGTGMALGGIGDESTDGYRDPTNPKEELKVPRFDITVLHELGHSVDERWGVMDGIAGNESCGAWHRYGSLGDLAAELAGKYLKAAGTGAGSAASVTAAIVATINTGKAERPEDVKDEAAWTALQKWLARCAKLFKEDFDGRGYSLGSNGHWYSYSRAVRSKTQVTAYQWTAPGEWFAELYAMTWYTKREPPASVDPKAKQYLFQKGAADGPGAPAAQGKGH